MVDWVVGGLVGAVLFLLMQLWNAAPRIRRLERKQEHLVEGVRIGFDGIGRVRERVNRLEERLNRLDPLAIPSSRSDRPPAP